MRAALAAEALGTFLMVSLGCGAAVWDHLHGGFGPVGVAAVFGAVVGAMVWTVGPVSGAHLNPAVTLTFLVRREITWRRAGAYILVQTAAASLGALVVLAVLPHGFDAALTRPVAELALAHAILIEVASTSLLVFVILLVATNPVVPQWARAAAIGAAVLAGALVAGPLTGGSMNPARSIGPALVGASWDHWWLYVLGPMTGGLLAFALFFALGRLVPALRPVPLGDAP